MKAPRILLVDDNPDVLKSYSKVLTRRLKLTGWAPLLSPSAGTAIQITWAVSVDEALRKLRQEAFDIVIVDLKLPGGSGGALGGMEVITESINLDPLRPVIVITGYGTLELARSTFVQGIFDFIDKSHNADIELVAAVQKALDVQAEKLIRAGNPFTPMAGLQPRVFGGRTSELEFFEERLNRAVAAGRCEHFVVLGDWGIGKSTLFQEYKKLCRSRGHVACVVPLEATRPGVQLLEVARSVVEGILRDSPYPLERFKRLTDFFQSFGVNVLGTGIQFSRDTSHRNSLPQAFLHDTFVHLWEDLKDSTEVVTILLDDLDNFQSVPEILITLRQVLSMEAVRRSRLIVGMSCTGRMWKNLIGSDAHHPLARFFFSRIELNCLTNAEMRDTIQKCIAGSGVSFDAEILERVWVITRGHPFEMQVLCSCLFDNQSAGHVGRDAWDKALETALERLGSSIFDRWLETLSGESRAILYLLAISREGLGIDAVCDKGRRQGLKVSQSAVAQILGSLVHGGILCLSSDSRYLLNDQMFGTYLSGVLKQERVKAVGL